MKSTTTIENGYQQLSCLSQNLQQAVNNGYICAIVVATADALDIDFPAIRNDYKILCQTVTILLEDIS
jgi:hypothetical protein